MQGGTRRDKTGMASYVLTITVMRHDTDDVAQALTVNAVYEHAAGCKERYRSTTQLTDLLFTYDVTCVYYFLGRAGALVHLSIR